MHVLRQLYMTKKGKKWGGKKLRPRFPQYDSRLKRFINFQVQYEDRFPVNGKPYKPKGAPTKRGEKRGQSKPRR